MAHDDGDGKIELEDDRVRIDWQGVGQPADLPARRRSGWTRRRARSAGRTVENPLWAKLSSSDLITVHPLGGCGMGEDAATGVVDHTGRCSPAPEGRRGARRAARDGRLGHPAAAGRQPPAHDLGAFAERNVALLAERRGWTIDYSPTTAVLESAETRLGIRFTERMSGWLSTAVTDDYEPAAQRAKADGSPFEFTVTVISDDLNQLLSDESHPAHLIGTVACPALSRSR